MNDRAFKKWRPFNSVVPSSELTKRESTLEVPILSKDEINEFEEKLKRSLYLKAQVTIYYIENNKLKEITDYVVKLDALKKDIYLKEKRINFRQIVKIK